MANEFYITAGLPAIDYNDIASVAANAFYITAGLTANDYTPAAAGNILLNPGLSGGFKENMIGGLR